MVRIPNFVSFGPILAQFRSKQLKIRPGIQNLGVAQRK